MLVYVFALAAALLFAIGSVVQQRAAALAPPQDVMSLRLLWWLVHQKLWLVGVVTALVGNAFSATALGKGGVAIVEPLLATRLLFAIPMAAAWAHRRPHPRDVAAAVVTAAGLILFIVAGHPSSKDSGATTTGLEWIIGIGVIAALSVSAAAGGRGLSALRRAPLLAGGAGLLFALQATLTSDADRVIGHPLHLLTTWVPYAVIVVAIAGTLFVQSAYEMAPLASSFPAQVTAEPIAGVILGVTVLNGHIRLAPLYLALEVLGLLIMVSGIFTLARSPLVTGQLTRVQVRDGEAQAYARERELFRSLRSVEATLDRMQHSPRPGAPRPRDQRRLRAELEHVDGELGRLGALLCDLERLHQLPTTTGWAIDGPLPDDDDAERFEATLRRWAEKLARETSTLCGRAESLIPRERV